MPKPSKFKISFVIDVDYDGPEDLCLWCSELASKLDIRTCLSIAGFVASVLCIVLFFGRTLQGMLFDVPGRQIRG